MNDDFRMKCPECGHTEGFNISCRTIAYIDKEGVQGYSDMTYDHNSACNCPECSYTGCVSHFEQEGT